MTQYNHFNFISREPPIMVIHDTYSEEHRNKILNELLFLHPKLHSAEETGVSLDIEDGTVRASKTGVFLNHLYNNQEFSDILEINRMMYNIFSANHWFFNHDEGWMRCLEDHTLVSYYGEGGEYLPHKDTSYITAVTWFYQKPKNFTGGSLIIEDKEIECQDNTTVVFPGWLVHEVTPVTLLDKDKKAGGRFTISQFFAIGDRKEDGNK